MRKIRIAPTAKSKNFGVQIVDLHSELFQVRVCYETLGASLSESELRRGKPARRAFALLQKLRAAVPSEARLGDVSSYYHKVAVAVAVEWDGYWLHGDIPVVDFLNAIEAALGLALSGDADFTRPLRELNRRFPYREAA